MQAGLGVDPSDIFSHSTPLLCQAGGTPMPEPWGWGQVGVRTEVQGWACGYRVWPSDPSLATFLQTPPHAELLVRRPQGEACILRACGHPGRPAPGRGPAGKPLLALSCCCKLCPHPGAMIWVVRAHLGPPGAPISRQKGGMSLHPPLHTSTFPALPSPCVSVPIGTCCPASGAGDGYLASSSASRRGQEELALVPEAAE